MKCRFIAKAIKILGVLAIWQDSYDVSKGTGKLRISRVFIRISDIKYRLNVEGLGKPCSGNNFKNVIKGISY